MSHETICPSNLQYNFCQKNIAVSDFIYLFATCNEIILQDRRVFKNVSGIPIMSYCDWFLLKKLQDKLQWGCHTLQLVA